MSENRKLLSIMGLFLAILFSAAFIADGFLPTLSGVWYLQFHPARLINDYIAIAGIGPALANAAMVGLIGLVVVALSGLEHSGVTFAGIFTMAGFGLFGKTPLNVLPIIIGVYIGARLAGKRLRDYLIIALFGTALGPLTSALIAELGLTGPAALAAGWGGGIAAGLLLPSLAVSMLHLHQGYNLYNMGLTCGFLGLFASGFFLNFGHQWEPQLAWFDSSSTVLVLLVPVVSLAMLISGLLADGKRAWKGFKTILTISGRLPSDFVDMGSLSGAMVNASLIGLFGSLYVYLVKAPFNGPVIGGLFTIMGFAAFGTHVKNAWPVVLGVIVATLITGNPLNAPGPILAAIFCTTLAPLAGEFGIIVGLLAGFVHFIMVQTTGSWHGGMNLYNNGFAGGLTATLFVAVLQWVRSNRSEM